MRLSGVALMILAWPVFAGCDEEKVPVAQISSGISGVVHLGPQCAVETAGEPCEDEPADGVTVIVSERQPGEAYVAGAEVARTTTDDSGRFRVDVLPGEYVVTADAGMSCELMDARVSAEEYARVDVACDTGIR